MKLDPYILTASGRRFDFLAPDPLDVRIEDIAHALSMTVRFGGHTREFYSVAEHSVRVSWECAFDDAFHGLMHDAAEAYVGDVPSPLKQQIGPRFGQLERRAQAAIFERFDLSTELPLSVKVADMTLLATEGRDLVPGWPPPGFTARPSGGKIRPWTQIHARESFLRRYYELKTRR